MIVFFMQARSSSNGQLYSWRNNTTPDWAATGFPGPGTAEHVCVSKRVIASDSGAGGGVDSVFGRTGTVVAVAGDYSSTHITNSSAVAGATVTAALNALAASIVLDHGALTGLADDDHTQYSLVNGTRAFTGGVTVTQTAVAGSTPVALRVTGGPHTTAVASTELTDLDFNLARTVQFATGAITTQRAARLRAPTYGFVGASVITSAATLAISGAPVAGTNATITNAYAFWVESGLSRFDGNLILQSGAVAASGNARVGNSWTMKAAPLSALADLDVIVVSGDVIRVGGDVAGTAVAIHGFSNVQFTVGGALLGLMSTLAFDWSQTGSSAARGILSSQASGDTNPARFTGRKARALGAAGVSGDSLAQFGAQRSTGSSTYIEQGDVRFVYENADPENTANPIVWIETRLHDGNGVSLVSRTGRLRIALNSATAVQVMSFPIADGEQLDFHVDVSVSAVSGGVTNRFKRTWAAVYFNDGGGSGDTVQWGSDVDIFPLTATGVFNVSVAAELAPTDDYVVLDVTAVQDGEPDTAVSSIAYITVTVNRLSLGT